MNRFRTALAAAIVLMSVMFRVGPAQAAPPAHVKSLFALLNGASEQPGPGDPDGTGTAAIFVDLTSNTLCLNLDYQGVDGAESGLHIHLGPPTSPGPVVVPFAVPSGGHTEQCLVIANTALLQNIVNNPQQYYINLHSAPQYPAGAIRGQLSRALLRTGANLTGAAERPGPGDPDGEGTFDAFIDDPSNTLCYFLRYNNVDGTPTGFHIHLAPPTAPGPIVVPFPVPIASPSMGCLVIANEALGDNLIANPQQYYVNLHSTPTYPAGAIRGQLPGCTINATSPRTYGTEGDDVICGTDAAEQIFAGGGDDIVVAGEGGGYADGGDGHDILYGGSSPEYLFGQGGDDVGFAGGGFDRCQSVVIAVDCEQTL
jgi:hypothetical protein